MVFDVSLCGMAATGPKYEGGLRVYMYVCTYIREIASVILMLNIENFYSMGMA